MPQGFFTPQEIHLRLYGDLTGGGIRIQLVLLAAITGSQLVSRDLSDQSIHLYLARPLTRVDYLLARLLTLQRIGRAGRDAAAGGRARGSDGAAPHGRRRRGPAVDPAVLHNHDDARGRGHVGGDPRL